MSGSGQPGHRAPTRLTPIEIDQPIADPATGRPTPYFGQMVQRILSYLGQPGPTTGGGTGGGGSGLTITEQLNTLNTQVEILQATSGGNTPRSGLAAQVAVIENIVRNLLRYQRPPKEAAQRLVVPAAPQPRPNFAGAQMLSWWRS